MLTAIVADAQKSIKKKVIIIVVIIVIIIVIIRVITI